MPDNLLKISTSSWTILWRFEVPLIRIKAIDLPPLTADNVFFIDTRVVIDVKSVNVYAGFYEVLDKTTVGVEYPVTGGYLRDAVAA